LANFSLFGTFFSLGSFSKIAEVAKENWGYSFPWKKLWTDLTKNELGKLITNSSGHLGQNRPCFTTWIVWLCTKERKNVKRKISLFDDNYRVSISMQGCQMVCFA
jgi:hypothetical protein